MVRRLPPFLLALAMLAATAPATSATRVDPPEQLSSPLLGEGCTGDRLIRGKPIPPALLPCGVLVERDGTTRIVPAPGGIALADETSDAASGWSRHVRPSPERRVNIALAYLPALNGVVMYGGFVCPGFHCSPSDETWLWNGSKWNRLQPATSPPPLLAPAMTYDPVREELVLFGGETCSPTDCFLSSETWTFDGITWEKQNVVLPPIASAASAMAFDPKSSRVILSGGCAQDRCPGLVGTWSWDGRAWELEDLLTPTPRAGASMATNPDGGVVLFGGTDVRGAAFAETWLWDGGWVQRQPATWPPSRMYAGATLHQARDEVVLFAGRTVTCSTSCFGSYVNDTWTWDGQTWTQRPSDPAPRGGQSLAIAYDAARNEVVRFGGISNFLNYRGFSTTAYESSTWLWDGGSWQERRSPMPEERTHAAMGFHPGAGVLVLTGGNCLYTTTCDTWTWDGETWTSIGAPAPIVNSRASLIPDAETGSLLMPLADAVWSLDYDEEEERWSWSTHPGSPSPGGNGSTTAGDRNGRVIEFGAQICSPCTYADRTWTWKRGSWEEAPVAVRPPGRAFAMMTFEPRSRETFMFGGLTNGGAQYFKDTWRWEGDGWTEVAAPGPPDRAFTRIAADPVTGEILVLGGISGAVPAHPVLGDQWLFNGETWREVSAAGPAHRIELSLAADPARSNIVLFGGQDENPGFPMSDTWIWHGES